MKNLKETSPSSSCSNVPTLSYNTITLCKKVRGESGEISVLQKAFHGQKTTTDIPKEEITKLTNPKNMPPHIEAYRSPT